MTNGSLERAGAWATAVYLCVFGSGWWFLAHFMPPFAPSDSRQAYADLFLERHTWIMLGAVLMMVATVILMPYSALLVMIIRKVEGHTGMLTLTMTFTVVTYQVMNFYTPFSFAMATFRTDRDAASIQFAGDWGFMQFMGGIPMFWMIWVVAAYAALARDPAGVAILPRWYGYFNIWCAVLYVPELLIFFFHTGPFAWNGIVGYWIPMVVFVAYFCVSFPLFLSIAKRHFSLADNERGATALLTS